MLLKDFLLKINVFYRIITIDKNDTINFIFNLIAFKIISFW